MRKLYLTLSFLLVSLMLFAQNPGDTIKVKTFHYGSNNRDTIARFPSGNLTFEKIIMKYNMRCKNALVSTGDNRNLGCGEWDYSCNTYIVDSSKVEEVAATLAKYVISNFTGTNFAYTTKPVYDYYRFTQRRLQISSTQSDSQFSIGSGTHYSAAPIFTPAYSGKSQYIYTASELSSAMLGSGQINSLILQAQTSGTKAGFLKIKMKHTNRQNMELGTPELSGFTEVFFSDFIFVQGANRIPFHSPFNWNGTDNILVEFSFTNTEAQNPLQFASDSLGSAMGLFAINNYALNLSHQGEAKLDTTQFSKIKNEITLSFWAFGNANQMPITTSILYGYDANPNNRQLNIHLPHSSANVYFDCGFSAGGYDRVNKIATAPEMGGKWNHWTFVKNAITGDMKVFLNGQLWLSGTGKVKPITLLTLILGKDQNGNNNFKGKINQLMIWNKALADSLIPRITRNFETHQAPLIENLVAYYPMNEGSGNQLNEQINSKQVVGKNFRWGFDRGEQLSYGFTNNLLRPSIIFTRSEFTLSNNPIVVVDSVERATHVIEEYSITSRQGAYPISNDIVNLVATTSNYYWASPSLIYNGDLANLPVVDSSTNLSEGTLAMSNLNFFRRFPWYDEIMSFVTPYGIGLNLGVEGRTWYFDVSDFEPILKGNKRILMTLGGQNQEQNDVEFWFIVGTPPRNVISFNQIWQGTNRTGQAPLTAINNQNRFAPVNVPIPANGKYFKMRSSITGHGAEGEFESNGGQVIHYLNANGGANEFEWIISEECAFNPVFPQGGTWVYDRQGWCPGQRSLLKEFDFTPHVTAGGNASIDYNASTPQNPSGAYNFHVAHQLVSYGEFNFTKDVRMMDILQPNNAIVHGKKNPMCENPKIVIQNSGKNPITQILFSYGINNGTRLTHEWKGNLAAMQTDTIVLPHKGTLWNNGISGNTNTFHAQIAKVNDADNDDYTLNNQMSVRFTLPEIVPSVFTLEFRTNNRPTENSYKLYDDWGNLIDSKEFTEANTTFSKQYNLGGCFKLVVEDKGHDGVQWWANSAQGTGFIRIRRANNTILKTFQPDFGGGFEYSFTTNWALTNEEVNLENELMIFPNPSRGEIHITGNYLEGASARIINLLGQEVMQINHLKDQENTIQTKDLGSGIYIIKIETSKGSMSKKISVE
ncbi:MAG: LamG-like jellyroll fold domain-containing protein [Bacteroidota bacterium]|nr:LamG-like jellyroll fold domain-containing protein [Bacteroidota bacterium]